MDRNYANTKFCSRCKKRMEGMEKDLERHKMLHQKEKSRKCSIHEQNWGWARYDPRIEEKVLDIIGGDILINGVEVPKVGLPLPIEALNPNMSISTENNENLYDMDVKNDHIQIIPQNDDVILRNIHENKEEGVALLEDSSYHEHSSSKTTPLQVRPPKKNIYTKSNKKTNLKASIEQAIELAKIGKEKNAIKREYYKQKLEIMRENNKIQERIAISIERLLEHRNGKKIFRNGFRRTGIWPFNADIFKGCELAAAETTNTKVAPYQNPSTSRKANISQSSENGQNNGSSSEGELPLAALVASRKKQFLITTLRRLK
ncbi:uncharacterized protein LOC115880514 [Sitophilus oryzae]|uniref:Uncharacterized protein LOC115880514 n=1 Tax=Sitophilus oryzae TaxID=7048 RepID=A0A6J2XQ11_SITOR|nr:uncharacterized protein LOC115880514 [Sitophilus oryzae]